MKKAAVRVPKGHATRTTKSAFDDTEKYVLTALGGQFVSYTMNELVPRIGTEAV